MDNGISFETYKSLIKKLNEELKKVEPDNDVLYDISYTFERQRDYLDDDLEDSIKTQLSRGTLIDSDIDICKKLLKERKLYKKHEKEIDLIINEEYDSYRDLRNTKRATKIVPIALIGFLTVAGIGFSKLFKSFSNNEEKTTESTVKEKGTDKVVSNNSVTEKIINDVTEKITEQSTELIKAEDIEIIKEGDLNNTESNNLNKNANNSKKDKKSTNNTNNTNNDSKSNNVNNNKIKDDNKQTNNDNNEQNNKSSKEVNKVKEDIREESTTEENKETKPTENVRPEEETTEEKNSYRDLQPEVVIIDNLEDNKSDIVVDNPVDLEDNVLPSLDNVDGDDEKTYDLDNTSGYSDDNSNKVETVVTDNTELPSLDIVEGDDEITYNITGSINKPKKLTFTRGRL